MALADWYWGDGNSTLQNNDPTHTYVDFAIPHSVNMLINPVTDVIGIDLDDCGVTSVDVSNYTDLISLLIGNNPALTAIDLSNNPDIQIIFCNDCNISTITFPVDTTIITDLSINGNGSLNNFDISSLTSLSFYSSQFTNSTTIDVSLNVLLSHVDVSFNQLPSTEINQLLIDLDTNGVTDGYLDYSNNADGPTVESSTAYDNLLGKNWTIIGNPPPYNRVTESGDNRVLEDLVDNRITE